VDRIQENLARVRERILRASERSGRRADSIELVAVSKTRSASDVREAVAAGVQVLGENRVQEALEKAPAVQPQASWHLVGHLQRNKARAAVRLFDLIHSVDSVRLAKELGRRALQTESQAHILVQVNTSGEASKFGIRADGALDLVGEISGVQGVAVDGLMTIGAFLPDPEAVRPCFARLRRLGETIDSAAIPGVSMHHLSMGMTSDYEVAIEEGATLVRVGTAVFGPREG